MSLSWKTATEAIFRPDIEGRRYYYPGRFRLDAQEPCLRRNRSLFGKSHPRSRVLQVIVLLPSRLNTLQTLCCWKSAAGILSLESVYKLHVTIQMFFSLLNIDWMKPLHRYINQWPSVWGDANPFSKRLLFRIQSLHTRVTNSCTYFFPPKWVTRFTNSSVHYHTSSKPDSIPSLHSIKP